MSLDASFDDVMARFQVGDADAAFVLFQRFGSRLIGLARKRLNRRIQQKVDPEDVMQSVFKSFCRRHVEKPFDLTNWDSLWSLLTVLTLRKCGHYTRYFQAQCREMGRETVTLSLEESARCREAIARDPSPTEAAILQELVEDLLRGLGRRDQIIVELMLQGYSPVEISAEVQCSERTVQRLRARVKRRLS